ncbi:Sel1 repeat protein [Acidovorax sp. CF316]|uniref:tetratricopeptide repeat protein n=1 Tax=Acidovorax sp. CF316 TaxID=1144317 RepID=UPI00026BC77B|nr:tetratricopeptide repeat protein [Acidovorax sp. CF316]EJE51322.1 Sel1 repeat protein [Acidovorax sp. CF316]
MSDNILSPLHRYLLRVNGMLTALQISGQNLVSLWPDFDPALLSEFEVAAEKGDAYAATVCSAIFRGSSNHQNYPLALRYAKIAADSDFPPGLAELSYCYEYGYATVIDLRLALDLAVRASWGGYGIAACNLALQYATAVPFGFDGGKAVEYATLAYKSGEAYGAYLLGLWYEEGLIIGRSLLLARIWYKKAAVEGSGLACIRLIAAYTRGELGLPKDEKMASKFVGLSQSINTA